MGWELEPVTLAQWTMLALVLWIVLAFVLRRLGVPRAVEVSAVASWVLAALVLAHAPSVVDGFDTVMQWVRTMPELLHFS